MWSFKLLFCLCTFNVILIQHSYSVRLESDGGYSIVLAIEPSTPEPEQLELNEFMHQIIVTVEQFSQRMFAATQNTFFLNQVDVLLPSLWNSPYGEYSYSISESYETADIRLNSNCKEPYANNPNACGLPGNYIELPIGFLNSTPPQTYGSADKALLNLWARLRYGVWEEHGDPGSNEKFPYFYKKNGFNEWEPTGCTNIKLEGNYTDSNGNSCKKPGGSKPSDDCIFHPSQENLAKSSLMTYHWLDSTIEFCNDGNHNKDAPNPQNHFCSYQSVRAVIENSDDYVNVGEALGMSSQNTQQFRAPIFNFLTKRELPSLFILVEIGEPTENDQAEHLIELCISEVVNTFSSWGERNPVVGVGSFFQYNRKSFSIDIPWKSLNQNFTAIKDAISLYNVTYRPNSDLGFALVGAINYIEHTNPSSQTALLVLKKGQFKRDLDNKVSSVPEEILLQSLRRNRITLFAAELENSATEYPKHLQRLAQNTAGGVHVSMKNISFVQDLSSMLINLTNFMDGLTPSGPTEEVIFKGQVSKRIAIPFAPGMAKDLKFHLTLNTSIPPVLSWTQDQGVLESRVEFGEGDGDLLRSTVYTVFPTLNLTVPIEEFFIEYTCEFCYTGDLLVTYTPDEDLEIQAKVSVSAINNQVDFNTSCPQCVVPFSIFAKVDKNGNKPVLNLTVTAVVQYVELIENYNPNPHYIALLDNGQGIPDIRRNDGVYSGVFIPPDDLNVTRYKISVEIKYYKAEGSGHTNHIPELGRLLPVDQFRPEIVGIQLDHSYACIIDYPHYVKFINVRSLELKKPYKILDFSAKFTGISDVQIQIEFTSPGLLGGVGKANRYVIQGAMSIDALIYGTADVRNVSETFAVREPGQAEIFILQLTESLTHFQVLAVTHDGGDVFEQVSNIASPDKEDSDEDWSTFSTPGGTTVETIVQTTLEISTSDIPTVETTPSTTEATIVIPEDTTPQITEYTTMQATTQGPTTTVRPPSNNTLFCSGEDPFGTFWNATDGQTAIKPCPGRSTEFVTWECQGGKFINSSPDYQKCKTDWIVDIETAIDEIIEVGELDTKKAQEFVDGIDANVMDAVLSSEVGQNGPNEYFGHEIANILSVLTKIIQNTTVENSRELRRLVERNYLITSNVLAFEKPWRQLIPKSRSGIMTNMLSSFQIAAFGLAGSMLSYFVDTFNSPERLLITSSYFRTPSKTTFPPTNPSPVKGRDTFLILPANWTITNQNGEISISNSYSGMMIEHRLIRNNLPQTLLREETMTFEAKETNSKLVGFSLASPESKLSVKFPDTPLQIVFAHEFESWGTQVQQVKRKLHLNESPRAAQGSVTCVYWDTHQLLWSTKGCRVSESGQYHTVCECNHLSEFAILMAFHKYVGKPFGLELITIIAYVSLTILKVTSLYSSTDINYLTKFLTYCILAGNLLLLVFVDRNYINLGDSFCEVVGMATHFVFLSGFIWMTLRVVDIVLVNSWIYTKSANSNKLKSAKKEMEKNKKHKTKSGDKVAKKGESPTSTNAAKVMDTQTNTNVQEEEINQDNSNETAKSINKSEDSKQSGAGLRSERTIPIEKTRIYFGVGFGIPLAIVAGTVAVARIEGPTVRAYGNEFCWLDGNSVWAFFGPMFLIVIGNAIFILLLYCLTRWNQPNDKSTLKDFRHQLKENGILSVAVCLTWVAGFFQLGPMYSSSNIVAYIFLIANTAQGLLVSRLNKGAFKGVSDHIFSTRGVFKCFNCSSPNTECDKQNKDIKKRKDGAGKSDDNNKNKDQPSPEPKQQPRNNEKELEEDAGTHNGDNQNKAPRSLKPNLTGAHTSGPVNVQVVFCGPDELLNRFAPDKRITLRAYESEEEWYSA